MYVRYTRGVKNFFRVVGIFLCVAAIAGIVAGIGPLVLGGRVPIGDLLMWLAAIGFFVFLIVLIVKPRILPEKFFKGGPSIWEYGLIVALVIAILMMFGPRIKQKVILDRPQLPEHLQKMVDDQRYE